MTVRIRPEHAESLYKIDEHLRYLLRDDAEKLWENTYIKRQIDRRGAGGGFSVAEHIRAMVYSMLCGGGAWNRLTKEADPQSGHIPPIDDIFHNYDPEALLKSSPEELQSGLNGLRLSSRSTAAQLDALLTVNIPKLIKWEREYGSIDNRYRQYINIDKGSSVSFKLIKALSNPTDSDSLANMDITRVCGYLQNAGYDFPRPDTHICRILGRDILSLSMSRDVPPYQAIKILVELSKMAGKSAAETGYILWAYCADEYGEICTLENPKCDMCVVSGQCRRQTGDITNAVKGMLLLNSHYAVSEADSPAEIVRKAASLSYKDIREYLYFSQDISNEMWEGLRHQAEKLLAERIPELLSAPNQSIFDERHHGICTELLHIYEDVGRCSYGLAQLWLNRTLTNLVIIDSSLRTSKLPVMGVRKYFHVPVDECKALKAAASFERDILFHSLNIKAAPMIHDAPNVYKMGWYSPDATQPFEKWEYAEYIEFQKAVREALGAAIKSGIYRDVLDWVFHAWLEVSRYTPATGNNRAE